jgi:hypothetical protein
MRPSFLQLAFGLLIVVQFVVIALHDLVDIPGWTHGSQVKAALGPSKVWIGTLINMLFPGAAAVLAICYWKASPPPFALNYWVIYCAVTVVSAIAMWWVPYFFGTGEKTVRLYEAMYAGTRQVLPARGNHPRPNLLHLYFHALFLTTLGLALALRVTR